MQKYKADAAITIPAQCRVGVTPSQYAGRAHNLTQLTDVQVAEGWIACIAEKPVQFKIGEVFYADEFPKNLASLVMTDAAAFGAESESGAGDSSGDDDSSDSDDDSVDFEKLTVPELKAYLDQNGVAYAASAKKPALIDLAHGVADVVDGDPSDSDESESEDSDESGAD